MSSVVEKPNHPRPRLRSTLPHVGVDIGSSSIKLIRTVWRRGRPRLLATASRPLSRPLDTPALDAGRLHRILIRELPRHNARRVLPATALLPTRCAAIRVVPNRQGIAEAAAEMGAGTQICGWPLPNDNGYVTFALPGALAEATADALATCGYRCEAVDANPLALWRVIRWQDDADFAVLDWGWQSCLLMLSSGGTPGVARDLPTAGLGVLVERTARRVGQPAARVLAAIRRAGTHHGLAESERPRRRDGEALLEWLMPEIDEVGRRLSETFHYAKRFGSVPQACIYLCGGASTVPGLAERLEQCLSVPVVPWSWQWRRRFRKGTEQALDGRFAGAVAASLGEGLQPMEDRT